MEEIVGRRECGNPNSTTPSLRGMHGHSHAISKVKPKIRIIHIFAPEIIKTDAENFRELVQRLTGKPSAADKVGRKSSRGRGLACNKGAGKRKMAEFRVLEPERVIKEEEQGWGGENSGGFLSGFGDLDGFMQEFGEFPLLPLDVSATHHMHGFGEAHQLS